MIVCVCVWRWGSYTGSFFFRNATSGRSQSCQTWFINGLKGNSTNFRHRRLLQVIGTSAAYTKRSCSSGYRGKSDKCPWVSLVSVWFQTACVVTCCSTEHVSMFILFSCTVLYNIWRNCTLMLWKKFSCNFHVNKASWNSIFRKCSSVKTNDEPCTKEILVLHCWLFQAPSKEESLE